MEKPEIVPAKTVLSSILYSVARSVPIPLQFYQQGNWRRSTGIRSRPLPIPGDYAPWLPAGQGWWWRPAPSTPWIRSEQGPRWTTRNSNLPALLCRIPTRGDLDVVEHFCCRPTWNLSRRLIAAPIPLSFKLHTRTIIPAVSCKELDSRWSACIKMQIKMAGLRSGFIHNSAVRRAVLGCSEIQRLGQLAILL